MTVHGRKALTNLLLLPGALTLAGIAAPVLAQDAASASRPSGAATTAPSPQVDGHKILQLLVQKGVITAAEAAAIEAQAAPSSAAPAAPVVKGGTVGDVQTVPYIPDVVKQEIKDELRSEMTSKAQSEGWARPGLIPGWLGKVTPEADVRVREELDRYDSGNDHSIPNFAAINAGAPFNINRNIASSPNPPFLDTTENRNRPRIRARLGVIVQPDSWVSFEIRGVTGNDASPVSPNQTLGAVGDFSKSGLWLDRADIILTPHGLLEGLRIDMGRGENPFWSTPILFYPDLQFDGFYARYRRDLGGSVQGFATAGAFPIYNTALNFGSSDVGAFESHDKWLYGGQLGLVWQPLDSARLTAAAAYLDFMHMMGKVSSPCYFFQDVCDTDNTRPAFQQFGNSVTPIRNIIPDPSAAPGQSPEPQYFGLASGFRVLDVHGAIDLNVSGSVPVRLEGDFIDNLAFNKAQVLANQINYADGSYNPGNKGWLANLVVGKPEIQKLGDWSLSIGYRHIDTDATVDGIADADFHLGGTNAKGYVLMGYFGFARNSSIGVRWFSSDVVTGAPYSNDVLQIDLNTKL